MRTTTAINAATVVAAANPMCAIPKSKDRHTDHTPGTCSERCDRDRTSLVSFEPRREGCRYRGGGQTSPTEPHSQKSDISLPELVDASDPGNPDGHGNRAQREDGARSKAADRATYRNKQERADDIKQSHAAGDEADGPASRFGYRMQIYACTEQTERVPDQARH